MFTGLSSMASVAEPPLTGWPPVGFAPPTDVDVPPAQDSRIGTASAAAAVAPSPLRKVRLPVLGMAMIASGSDEPDLCLASVNGCVRLAQQWGHLMCGASGERGPRRTAI